MDIQIENTTPENGVALLNEHPNAIKKNILKKVPLVNDHPNTVPHKVILSKKNESFLRIEETS